MPLELRLIEAPEGSDGAGAYHSVMAAHYLTVFLCQINDDLPRSKVEDTLFWLNLEPLT